MLLGVSANHRCSSSAVQDCLLLTSDKLQKTLKEMHWKVVAENEVTNGCTFCIHTGKSDSRYLPEGSDKGTNSENVHRSRGYQVLSVLSHVCKSCLHSSIFNTWAVHWIKFQNKMLPSNYNKTWTVFLMHDCPNLFPFGLRYPSNSEK